MSLSALVRKRAPVSFATATLATVATHQAKSVPTVASVATVTVANGPEDQPEKAITSFRWLIHFSDRDPITVTFSPEVSHAGALACPGAVAAEPVPEINRAPTPSETALLRQRVAAIYRDDTDDDRNEAIQAALADPDNALACYRAMAEERGLTLADDDDRRTCRQCASLRGGICSVATPGGAVSAPVGYRPALDLLQRCEGFEVKP